MLIVLIGPVGSGKSSIISEITKNKNFILGKSKDEFYKILEKYKELQTQYMSCYNALSSKIQLLRQSAINLSNREHVLYHYTLSKIKTQNVVCEVITWDIRLVNLIKELKLDCVVVFLKITLEELIKRRHLRNLENQGNIIKATIEDCTEAIKLVEQTKNNLKGYCRCIEIDVLKDIPHNVEEIIRKIKDLQK